MCRNRLYIGSKRRNAIEDLLNPFKEPFVQYKFPWMFSVLHGTIYANKEPSVGSIMLRILPDFLF